MKRVLVTGGARGIGYGIASRLAGDGNAVVIADLRVAEAEAVARSLPGDGHDWIEMDVSNEASVEEAYAQIEIEHRPIDGVVCNAGILILGEDGERTPIADTGISEWQATHDVNLTGTFLTIREYLRRRRIAPVAAGRIVTFTSSAAQLGGFRSSSSYISSKSGVIGLTKAVARECATDNITCNSIAPGLIDAPMLRQSLADGDEARAASAIPLGRIGTVEDVAGAVAYLLSDDAAFVTGAVLDVNGGYRMQ